MGKTLYEKVFDAHTVRRLPSGQVQLLMGLHLIHEVTSPQAFSMLRDRGVGVLHPERTFATVDHIIPTHSQARPLVDPLAEEMLQHLERNVAQYGIPFFPPTSGQQGIVHVIGPEKGLTQPGMTICCGDSHTSTHGAFGAIAFGIGTSQVRDVLASQCLAMDRLKVRRIEVNGRLRPGVYAKDVTLYVINKLGVHGGVGYAYEYAGEVIDRFSMEERMTLCNMSIEGGARCGYVNPDDTTYAYLQGREYAPSGAAWDAAVTYWSSVRSDADAHYDDVVVLRGEDIEPMVTWGITPAQSTPVTAALPETSSFAAGEQPLIAEAYEYMALEPGLPLAGTKIDVAFIGSCTNGRLSDFAEVVRHIEGRPFKVAAHVKALVVPGSQPVREEMIRRGWDTIFRNAGFDFREAGCSMCLAMNPDKLEGSQLCASSSNRNFKGRQGSPTGRTLLMSPVMVAAAAIKGEVTDARDLFDFAADGSASS
ncbi:MAG TPA: 3-isopropylmalate dehydratase large subunit [Candidatus Binatia bacterium]|jgi:3-isopropylmalate/(R)-2-methylmalate dehydratase large subunit|nr:3-isopropylmalate dehydratase large subunit [Candidatus Binatia bacterium]